MSTIKDFEKGYTKGYLEETVLMDKLNSRGKVKFNASGIKHNWKVKTAKNPTYESFGMADKANFVTTDNFVEAELEYAAYRAVDYLYEKEELQNKGDKTQIFNLKAQKLNDLAADFKLDQQGSFWTDDGTDANGNHTVVGLQHSLPNSDFSTTTSYAGISFAGNTYWQNSQINGAAGPNTTWATDVLDRIETAILACTHGNKTTGAPDFALVSKNNFVTIANAHTANERYRPVRERRMGGGEEVLHVHSIECYYDPDATAAVVYILNSNYMEMMYMTPNAIQVQEEDSLSPKGTAMMICSYPLLKIQEPRYFTTIHKTTS